VPTRLVVEAALRRLPPRQRAVLELRYFDDLTEARTAEILGVTVGTVKSQASAALRKLRELAPELGDMAGKDR
jgi:RNA polymerase sigma factor (sigma-70 family)